MTLLALVTFHHLLSTLLGAATLTVNNTNDSGSGSLRQAIQSASAGDTINFSVTGTITLTTGELLLTKNLAFNGPGGANLAISGNTNSRVLEINSNVTASISGLTIRDGYAGGIGGGGIYNAGALTLTACTISSNSGGHFRGDGGGIYNAGTLTLTACTVSGNTCGRGFYRDCESRGCHPLDLPGGKGGGIFNLNILTVSGCTFSGNRGGDKGGSLGLSPSGDGGGIYNLNILTVSACTFSGNSGGSATYGGRGGGIFNATNASSAILRSTLVALDSAGYGNSSVGRGPDLYGSFTSQGHNLIGQSDGSSGFTNGVNSDLVGSTNAPLTPMLGPLQDNGGPTFTLALLPGSPAIDAGDDALLTAPFNLITDQRGLPRKSSAHVDIGAYEFQVPPSLTGLTMLGNGQFRLTLLGEAGRSYTIQSSTDLATWTTLTNFVSATGTNSFTDATAPNFSRRFYRAVTP